MTKQKPLPPRAQKMLNLLRKHDIVSSSMARAIGFKAADAITVLDNRGYGIKRLGSEQRGMLKESFYRLAKEPDMVRRAESHTRGWQIPEAKREALNAWACRGAKC